MKVMCAVIPLAMVLGANSPAWAWWNNGHERIAEGGIAHLPPVLEAFFRTHRTYLKAQAGLEPPGTHYIDIDNYPEFDPNNPSAMSRDLNTLIALHGEDFVNQQGTGPWTAVNYVETLTSQMASANSASDWTALLFTAAELAHYVGDLHNPLHLTANYDGQLTGNNGIHGRYEGEMIWRNLAALSITANPAACVFLDSPIDTIFDGIYAHYPFVAPILAADSAHRGSPPSYGEPYYVGLWTDSGPFTQSLFQEASEVLASAWYTAWVNAGSPTPLYPPGNGDFDADGDVDLADAAGLQLCRTGAAEPACPRVDLDGDGQVDTADTGAFAIAANGPLGASVAQIRQQANGTPVTLGDVVLSSVLDLHPQGSTRDFYVQDETGGLRIIGHRYVIEAILYQVMTGDRIRLAGTLGERNGMRELSFPLNLLARSAGPAPDPLPTIALDYQAGSSTAESLEGRLVILRCATFPPGIAFCSNCTYSVATPAGAVAVWISASTSGLIGEPRPSDPVDLSGIFGQSDPSAPVDSGYQLWLRSAADVMSPASCP